MHDPNEKEIDVAVVLIKWALAFGGTKLALFVLIRQILKWTRE